MMGANEKGTEVLSQGPEVTERFGERLGALLRSGDVICLQGDLGAGKTTLAQGIARGWGVQAHVTSPTFTLLNEYERSGNDGRFYHLDCYRLADAQEAWLLGLDDVLDADGVLVIEWPERIEGALPEERLWIGMEHAGEGRRRLTLEASGARYEELLVALDPEGLVDAAGD